jgi:hypothetical protein
MELREIKNLNQKLYQLDTEIGRNSKTIFIATLIFAIKLNTDFAINGKLSDMINFNDNNIRPIDQLIAIAKEGINTLDMPEATKQAIYDSLRTISGVNTKLDKDRTAFKNFLSDFISSYSDIHDDDLFLETLYMEIDKKSGTGDDGIVLTPFFAAQLMIDLANINYKTDVIADLCCGTGLFSLLSYHKMSCDMNSDYRKGLITEEEYDDYTNRLYSSIIANDIDSKMITLCLANLLLIDINKSLIFCGNTLDIKRSNLKYQNGNSEIFVQPTKAILNPPYEDAYKPLEILEKNISLISGNPQHGTRVVVIVPPQKFGQKKEVFSRILNSATLECVIKMQDDLFIDSGRSQPASIFVFNVDKPHSKNDQIRYFNFTDTGYVYLKDSGLVDKNNTYNQKKLELLNKIENPQDNYSTFVRTWNNFYEVNRELEITTQLDPDKVKTNKEEADITLENITIKKMINEKISLLQSVENNFKDNNNELENYIIDILSED